MKYWCKYGAVIFIKFSIMQVRHLNYTKIIKRDICPNNDEFEDFSFYTFRKTHLSNMASNNCPVGELMSRAGHSKMETLYDNYYGRTEASEEKLIRAMNETASLIL